MSKAEEQCYQNFEVTRTELTEFLQVTFGQTNEQLLSDIQLLDILRSVLIEENFNKLRSVRADMFSKLDWEQIQLLLEGDDDLTRHHIKQYRAGYKKALAMHERSLLQKRNYRGQQMLAERAAEFETALDEAEARHQCLVMCISLINYNKKLIKPVPNQKHVQTRLPLH